MYTSYVEWEIEFKTNHCSPNGCRPRSPQSFKMQTLKHLSRRIIIVVTNTSKLGNSSKKTGWYVLFSRRVIDNRYLPEVAHPYFVFKRHGFNVNFVSPKGGIAPVDEQSVQQYSKDYLCSEFLHNHMHKLQNTKKVLDLDPKNYDAIFFAGGYGPMFDVMEITWGEFNFIRFLLMRIWRNSVLRFMKRME